MTYVEFFDKASIENMCACLTKAPTRVIFIGDKTKLMKKAAARYAQVMEDRGYDVEFIVKGTKRNDLAGIVKVLCEIVETYDNCHFDLTGGDDLYLVAAGIVRERYAHKNIQMHWFNLRNNTIADCDQDGVTIMSEPPHLLVEEQIRIYGGDILYDNESPLGTFRWDMNPEFCQDIRTMWKICSADPGKWNAMMNVLAAAHAVAEDMAYEEDYEDDSYEEEDPLILHVYRDDVSDRVARQKVNNKFFWSAEISTKLMKSGLLETCTCDRDIIRVVYKNEQIKKLMGSAGRVLEMLIYSIALSMTGTGKDDVYYDAMTGVYIDWDGELQGESSGVDTVNEVDLVLMRNMIPVFISCKNGKVETDELYKLASVADRFGGPYARKVLLVSNMEMESAAAKHLSQRAEDMGIRLVTNLAEMEEETLVRTVKNLWAI